LSRSKPTRVAVPTEEEEELASANPAVETTITLSFHLIAIVMDYPF